MHLSLACTSVSGIDTQVIACRLDSLANQEAITTLFLQAIDACPEELQKDIITVLPELVSEDEHEVGRIVLFY